MVADLIAALEGLDTRTPWQDDFLALLADSAPDDEHFAVLDERRSAFFEACQSEGLMRRVIEASSQLRSLARDLPMIEFWPQFPVDDLDISPDARLDPLTCRWRDR